MKNMRRAASFVNSASRKNRAVKEKSRRAVLLKNGLTNLAEFPQISSY